CGYGRGFSVLEAIETVKRVSGVDFKVEFAARRAGDPARLVAACDLARSTLKWQPRFDDLRTIVTHALAWERKLQTAGCLRVRRPHLKQPLGGCGKTEQGSRSDSDPFTWGFGYVHGQNEFFRSLLGWHASVADVPGPFAGAGLLALVLASGGHRADVNH